jgi:hypothetical protein
MATKAKAISAVVAAMAVIGLGIGVAIATMGPDTTGDLEKNREMQREALAGDLDGERLPKDWNYDWNYGDDCVPKDWNYSGSGCRRARDRDLCPNSGDAQHEPLTIDLDGDGIPNCQDQDDDGDGIPDNEDDYPRDRDNDGTPDCRRI